MHKKQKQTQKLIDKNELFLEANKAAVEAVTELRLQKCLARQVKLIEGELKSLNTTMAFWKDEDAVRSWLLSRNLT